MKKAARQIAALAGMLLIICMACRLMMNNTYMASIPVPPGMRENIKPEAVRFTFDQPNLAVRGTPQWTGERLRVPIQPQRRGEAFMDVDLGNGAETLAFNYRVGPLMTVYDTSTGGFTGDGIALTAVTTFFLASAFIMYRAYRRARGPAFYSYSTIYAVGFTVFALVTGMTMLIITVRHFIDSSEFSMFDAYSAISGAGFQFMLVTLPLLVSFAISMAVSNIALLRHERFRPQNVLGIGIGVLLIAGEALGFAMLLRGYSGSQMGLRLCSTLQNVYATAFAYFECMLFGAVVCGLKAAKHTPPLDADYILILGCRFRRDGTLTPLLQGRVDRAIELWQAQRAAGKTAVLVPSGGQGPDEVMPEARAMRNYLLQKGVPEECIMPEERSRNTYQNMEYSKELIENREHGAKAAYVTTNYHVFRSGVLANLAGMPAEGAGSRTKWWYWPNAFMRECAGLMVNRVKQEILLLVALIAFFGALSMTLGW